MSTAKTSFFQRHDRVLLYVPNLIGATIALSSTCACRGCIEPLIYELSHLRPQSWLINERTPLRSRSEPGLHCAGYFRVACIVYAFAAADRHPRSCLLVYFVGFACDELDGRFARMLDQRSRLGAVLDMATDRVSTAGLLALLCKFAPAYSLLWALLIVLDVSSHWFQMYATLAYGDTTHKVRRHPRMLCSAVAPHA